MIEINADNLKWAFKKLKTYYFYYHSSNYLKEKIINFEKKLNDNKTSFESIANNLKCFLENPMNRFSDYYNYGYLIYPKRNSFSNQRGKTQINLENTNYFIDLDISIHLVDILFCLEIIESQGESINTGLSFGGIVDKRIFKSSDIIRNKFLFEDYKNGYLRWLNLPTSVNISSADDSVVIRTDLKSCFYNVKFNFNTLLSIFGIGGSECARVMKNVFNLYTSIISEKTNEPTKEYRMVILPIGLASSQIILNFLLKDLDEKLASYDGVISYGRYVDDLIIVYKNKIENDLLYEDILTTIFSKVFYKVENTVKLSKLNYLSKNLEVNLGKTIVKPLKNITNENEYALFEEVSFCDYYDVERENSPAFFFKDYTSDYIRSIVYDTISEIEDKAFNIIVNCDNAIILNSFTFWNDILTKFKQNTGQFNAIVNKIDDAIKEITCSEDKSGNVSHIDKIKATLRYEFELAKKLTEAPESNAFFGTISQEQLFELIDLSLEKQYEFAPMIFSIADISLYLSKLNFKDYSNHIDETISLYKSLNLINDISGFNINNYEIKKIDRILQVKRKSKSISRDRFNSVCVALGALNMEELEKYDVLFKTPPYYSIDDIFRFVKTAYANKASYLLLPEFALDFSWTLRIIKECRKRHITLISGVIHHKMHSGKVANFTLIYDHRSGLVFLKPKNYLSPDEKSLIKYKGMEGMSLDYYEPSYKYYLVVYDGVISFSTMTCYEATNILDRALLADKINVLFMPVFNYDTEYFKNIINSFSRDISCYILQSNSNIMGDTKIRMPISHVLADLTKVKGGINNYCIIEKISVDDLYKAHVEFFNELREIDKGLISPKIPKVERKIKKLSAGNHHFEK